MSLQRNYYEVLGIPQGATTDQIKKKYRELARRFHPDVVQDKDLGQRVFSQINQAYRVLADPERRAQYNITLTANGASGNGANSGTASQPQPHPAQSTQAQTAARSQTATRPQTGGTAQTRPAEPQGQAPSVQKTQAIVGLLRNADNAIMAGKPVEARVFCVKVLEIDPRNVRALDILGDALTQMGQREEAVVQYRKALAIAPSHTIQMKLTRIEQAGPSTRAIPPNQPTAPSPAKSAAKTITRPTAAQTNAEKASGLLGRFLGRK